MHTEIHNKRTQLELSIKELETKHNHPYTYSNDPDMWIGSNDGPFHYIERCNACRKLLLGALNLDLAKLQDIYEVLVISMNPEDEISVYVTPEDAINKLKNNIARLEALTESDN